VATAWLARALCGVVRRRDCIDAVSGFGRRRRGLLELVASTATSASAGCALRAGRFGLVIAVLRLLLLLLLLCGRLGQGALRT